jgi:hypothetical protein
MIGRPLARLEHAHDEKLLVRVRRWIPRADRLDGFVVGVGATWVALHHLSDRVTFDGWQLVRLTDIQAVSTNPDPDCFEMKALQARSLWPPMPPAVDLDGTVGMITSAAAAGPLISVFDEFASPDLCWIGVPGSVDQDEVRLIEVGPRADWSRKPRRFSTEDITRLDVGGGYEEALHLVAGPRPPSD